MNRKKIEKKLIAFFPQAKLANLIYNLCECKYSARILLAYLIKCLLSFWRTLCGSNLLYFVEWSVAAIIILADGATIKKIKMSFFYQREHKIHLKRIQCQ